MELIDQDDVFFADLSKQISLLIMDDDNDTQLPVSHIRPTAPFQTFSRVIHPSTTQSQVVIYEQSCKRNESKGTGVFIPRSTHPSRRRHKQQGRTSFTSTASSNKFQKHSAAHSSRGLPHDLLPISHTINSFNYTRY